VCSLSGHRLGHCPTLSIRCFIRVIIIYLFQVDIGVKGDPVGDGRPSTIGCIIGDISRALLGLLPTLLMVGALSLPCTAQAITVMAEVPLLVTVIALNVFSSFLPLPLWSKVWNVESLPLDLASHPACS